MLTAPPDDTGADVLERFRYQAQIAFPFCLSCYIGDEIVSIYMEHFEDLVIEYRQDWVFVQIKTRDAEFGPWKLTDCLSEVGGLRSLYRTYAAIKRDDIRLSLHLEGAIKRQDLLNKLSSDYYDPTDIELVKKTASALEISIEESRSFLSLVSVVSNLPQRSSIAARNLRALGVIHPRATYRELENLYDSAISEILKAMSAELRPENIIKLIVRGDSADAVRQSRLASKQITRDQMISLLGVLKEASYPLLKSITDAHYLTATNLEIKLLTGGASAEVLSNAKQLRANASIQIAELNASGIYSPDGFEDVSQRVITTSNATIQTHVEENKPVVRAWDELLQRFMDQCNHLDPSRIFARDPMLLMGLACELTDQCVINWGGQHA